MSVKTNTFRLILIGVMAALLAGIGVLLCAPKPDFKPALPPSENEQFLSLQQKYTRNLEHTILTLLEPLVGPNKVRVAAKVELNLKNERLKTQMFSPAFQENEWHQTTDIFAKDIQNIIEKQHISVVVDGNTRKGDKGIYQARTPKEMSSFRRLIESAIGFDHKRGDTLEIQNMPFAFKAPQRRMPHPPKEASLIGAVFVLAFCFILLLLTFKKAEKHPPHKSVQSALNHILLQPARTVAVLKNWIYLPPAKKSTDWTPIQKAGIVLLALDEETVRKILVALDDEEVRLVAKTMATLGVIPPEESVRVLEELNEAIQKGSAVVGNPARVQQIFGESASAAAQKATENLPSAHQALWEELEKLPAQTLAQKLSTLRPELAAFILYQLPTLSASNILKHFSEKQTTQVLIHLSHIGRVRPDTTHKMEKEAVAAAHTILENKNHPTAEEKTAAILENLAQTPAGQNILNEFAEYEPKLAQTLVANLIHFEDIAKWSNTAIQTLLKHTPRTTAMTALVNAPQAFQKAVQRNIPAALWEELQKEICAYQMRITAEQIATARKSLVETAKTLLKENKIQI